MQLERTTVNLRLISKLQAGNRVCTQYVFFTIIKNDIVSKLKRSFFGSNRASDFARIISLYESAMNSDDSELRALCIESLVGLSALRETYIDDITNAISMIIEKPKKNKLPYQIFNIGSGDPKKLTLFLSRIEKELNKKSKKIMKRFQLGDVKKTHANIDALSKVTSFKPKNNINSGIKKFIDWYKKYYSK